MIQNLLILKKGIPGFVYAKIKIDSEETHEPTVTVTEVNE